MKWWLATLLALAGCSSHHAGGSDDAGAPVGTSSGRVSASVTASASSQPSTASSGPCVADKSVTFLVVPQTPVVGMPLRVLAVSHGPLEGALKVFGPGGAEVSVSTKRLGGPPFSWVVEVPTPAVGAYRVAIGKACSAIDVADAPTATLKKRVWNAAWPVHAVWSRETEDLYSAWIETMFDAPLEESLAWPALHEVLRDPKRNVLHDYLGEGEDDATGMHPVVIQPDCADLPYFLRAYFSHKLGLPFGYSSCTRGGGGMAPHCLKWHSNLEHNVSRLHDPSAAFGEFLRVTLADSVHSGTGRALAEDDKTDSYPVSLSLDSLRPGTMYDDPYGHVLVVVKRTAGTKDGGGVLLAVDGQPDGTVSRRRFWRGNFLFSDDRSLGSPGFKRFRPVVVEDGRARTLTNAEIGKNADYGDYSLDQYAGGVEGFYDKMDDVLSPIPLDPKVALLDTIDTFEEQVKGRVLSVANGQKYLATGGATIDMPEGPSIFETTGPWEDFSTPSRDLRLLIAIDVVTGFPARVARRASRYAVPAGANPDDVKKDLEALLSTELDKRHVAYARSDGSSFELSLAEVVKRAKSFEMAYNPNDCVEVRWGAPPRSDESKTCRHRAPGDQVIEMRSHRAWFRARKRPPRG